MLNLCYLTVTIAAVSESVVSVLVVIMGDTMSCECFEQAIASATNSTTGLSKETLERLEQLKKGETFKKNILLGISKQELFVQLSDDTSALFWKINNTWTAEEHGQIDLTSQLKICKIISTNGLQFLAIDNSVILEIYHDNNTVRDQWVITINELLQFWVDNPNSKPKSSVSAAGASNKQEYFKKREAEILAREKVNAERKAKYASGGMTFTAQAMANRSI